MKLITHSMLTKIYNEAIILIIGIKMLKSLRENVSSRFFTIS